METPNTISNADELSGKSDAVEEAVNKYKCRIISGSPKWLRLSGDVKTVSGYGPDRFLSLIKNSECVITNSFHGTAFSIIYQKDFITVPHSTRGKRMEDLLQKLGKQVLLQLVKKMYQ